jgi:hypothetical protein
MQQRIQPILARYKKKIADAIRNGTATEAILRDMFDELRAALGPEIASITTGRVLQLMDEIGIGADLAVISQEALSRSRAISYQLAEQLTTTTRALVEEVMYTYTSTPGMTRGDLVDLLEPAFGEARANRIAVTEVTRIYSDATNEYQRMALEYGVEMRRIWLTLRDNLTCAICGPLHGMPESVWEIQYPDGPPAHPNCRCSTELTVETEEEAMARGEAAQAERMRIITA